MSTTRNAKLRAQNRLDFARARRGEKIDRPNEAAYDGVDDPVLIVERLIVDVVAATRRGMPDRALRLVSENQTFLDENLGNVEAVFVWAYEQTLGIVTNHSLEYEASIRHLSSALSLAYEMNDPACKYPTMIMLGRTLQRRGDIAESIRLLVEINRSTDAADNIVALAQSYLAELFTAQGQHEIALKHRLASIDEDLDLSVNDRAVLSAATAGAYVQVGRLDDARTLLAWTRSFSQQGVSPYVETATDLVESHLSFAEGDQAVARNLARSSIIEFEQTVKLYDEMRARLHMARIDLAEGQFDEIEQFGADPRIARMEAPYQVQVWTLLAAVAESRSDWRTLTEHQDEILRLEDLMGTKVAEVYPLLREFEAGKTLRQRRNVLAASNERLLLASAAKQRLFEVVGQGLRRPLYQLDQSLLDHASHKSTDRGGGAETLTKLVAARLAVRRVQAIVSQLNLLADPDLDISRYGFTNEQVRRCLLAAFAEARSVTGTGHSSSHQVVEPPEGDVSREIRTVGLDGAPNAADAEAEMRLHGIFVNLLSLSASPLEDRSESDRIGAHEAGSLRLPFVEIVEAGRAEKRRGTETTPADYDVYSPQPVADPTIQVVVGRVDQLISGDALAALTRSFFATGKSESGSDVSDVGLSPCIGLALACELARSLGGSVTSEPVERAVEESVKQRTTFRVTMPLSPIGAERAVAR